MKKSTVRRRLAWLALFGLALGLRLYFIGQARFAEDEARYYDEACAVVEIGRIPDLGPPVTGGSARLPGGSFSMLMGLPLLLVSSPLACAVLVVLLNMLAYAVWIDLVRRVRGDRTALVFGTLLLLSPWSFLFSDRIWNPNLLLLFSGLTLWSVERMARHPRSRHAFWLSFSLLIVPQFHLSGILLWPLAGGAVVLMRPRVHLRALVVGALVAAVLYGPYLSHELSHDLGNTRALLDMPADRLFDWTEPLEALWHVPLLASSETSYWQQVGYWYVHDEWQYYVHGRGLYRSFLFFGRGAWSAVVLSAVALTVLVSLLATLRYLRQAWRERRRLMALVRGDVLQLGFWFLLFCFPLFLALTRKSYQPHYLLVLLPLCLVPLAVWLGEPGWWSRAHRWVAYLCLASLANVASTWYVYANIEKRFSVPAQKASLTLLYRHLPEGQPFRLALLHGRSNMSTHSYRVLSERDLQRPLEIDPRARWALWIGDGPTLRERTAGETIVEAAVSRRWVSVVTTAW